MICLNCSGLSRAPYLPPNHNERKLFIKKNLKGREILVSITMRKQTRFWRSLRSIDKHFVKNIKSCLRRIKPATRFVNNFSSFSLKEQYYLIWISHIDLFCNFKVDLNLFFILLFLNLSSLINIIAILVT